MAMTGEQPRPGQRGARTVAVPITKLHGDWVRANYRLAPIVNGRVYCLHSETAEPVECAFSTDSGCWAEGGHERYAGVGQAISRDGEPGGDYIVAARISADFTVPCVEPRLLADSSGTPGGCELSGGAVIEVMLSASNVSGRSLRHYCQRQVCTSSHPHPDGAELVGGATGPTFCYIGSGAALNDISGHEADEFGRYIPGSLFAHVVWSNGLEVPAAKRPAVRSFPRPPTVMTNTPIVWRPVCPSLQIGSPLFAGGCP